MTEQPSEPEQPEPPLPAEAAEPKKVSPKVVDRVRKLLALANSSNPNEAASAAAKAAQILQDHKLSEADVADIDDPDSLGEVVAGSAGMMDSWRFTLVTGIARAFFCEAIGLRVKDRRRVRIVGKKEDALVALEVYRFVVDEVERLAHEEVEQHASELSFLDDLQTDMDADTDDFFSGYARTDMYGSTVRDVNAFVNNFCRGATVAVCQRLVDERKAFARQSERALVLVEKSQAMVRSYLQNKYGESQKPEVAAEKMSAEDEAYYRGYTRGMEMQIPGRAGEVDVKQLKATANRGQGTGGPDAGLRSEPVSGSPSSVPREAAGGPGPEADGPRPAADVPPSVDVPGDPAK
jgi:hypothetical protein